MDSGLILQIILAFLTGIVAGYLSGLLGIGSGMIMVPAAYFFLGMDFIDAKAMSLFVIMFISPLGMLRHHSHGNIHVKTGLYLGIPGLCGSFLGVYIAGVIDITYLKIMFALVQFFAAYRMIYGSADNKGSSNINQAFMSNKKILPGVGFVGGLAAGLLGIGGGVIMVPSMVFLAYPMHAAVGNSLMVISINSLAGTAAHAFRGELDIRFAIPMMLGAIITIRKGADMSVTIDREKLRKYFGYFMIIAGCYLLYRTYIG